MSLKEKEQEMLDRITDANRRELGTLEDPDLRDSFPVSIRQAVPEDAPTLARMRWDDSTEDGTPVTQPDGEFEAAFAEFVRHALATDQWVIWLAESDGRLVSHVYVQIVGMVPRPGRFARRWGYAAAVYAAPDARNQGIGSTLLRSVIEWAKQEGLESLLLWPSDRSVPFYQRTGFVRSRDVLELHLDT